VEEAAEWAAEEVPEVAAAEIAPAQAPEETACAQVAAKKFLINLQRHVTLSHVQSAAQKWSKSKEVKLCRDTTEQARGVKAP